MPQDNTGSPRVVALDELPLRPWQPIPNVPCAACSDQAVSLLERYTTEHAEGLDLSVAPTPWCGQHWEEMIGHLSDEIADLGTSWNIGSTSLRQSWTGWLMGDTSLGRILNRSPLTVCWTADRAPDSDLGLAIEWRYRRLVTSPPSKVLSAAFRLFNRVNII